LPEPRPGLVFAPALCLPSRLHSHDLEDNLTQTMTAIEIATPGGPEALKPVSRPVPVPAAGEVLIAVEAAVTTRRPAPRTSLVWRSPAGSSRSPTT
jgi:NADPH2:quinone reductase